MKRAITHTLTLSAICLLCSGCEDFKQKYERTDNDVANQVSFGGESTTHEQSGLSSLFETDRAEPTPTKTVPSSDRVVPGRPEKSTAADLSEEGFGGLGAPRAKSKHDPQMGPGGLGKRSSGGNLGRKKRYKKKTLKRRRRPSKKSDDRSPSTGSETTSFIASSRKSSSTRVKPTRKKARKIIEKQPEPEEMLGISQSGDGEGYDNHGVNPMTKTSKDRFSTFSIDVDTGSYTIARRKLNEGVMPPAASVRVEEFVNYFDYGYEGPTDSSPFTVAFDGAPSPFRANADRHLIRIGVQGNRLENTPRKPLHLVFLVDVSGSMKSRDKLGLIKQSLETLTENLHEDDTVALVTYAAGTKVALPPTRASESIKILEGILNLTPGGGTDMGDGMETAYKIAIKDVKPGHVSRVIVLSDGDASIGDTSMENILKRVKTYVDEGVTLSAIGFGMGNYKDNLMEQLANKGNGNYYYIDTKHEAEKVFNEQLRATMEVIARDVKIQVEFDPEIVEKYRLVGYENRDIADKDFRNDKVDAGEIGAGHSVTALYEVEFAQKLPEDAKIATVRIRHKKPDGFDASEQSFPLLHSALASSLQEASPSFKFAVAVVGFAETLRGSPYIQGFGLDQIIALASVIEEPSARQNEFVALVEQVRDARTSFEN